MHLVKRYDPPNRYTYQRDKLKKIKAIFLLGVLSFLYSNTLHSQWVQTNGPNSGSIRALAVIGTNLFAGTIGGVYLSMDNGTTWTAVNSGLDYPGYPTLDVSSLVVSGTNLFSGTHWGIYGVSFSPLSPTLWTPVNNGLTSPIVPTLAVYSTGTAGANLFAGTTTGGILISTNSGGNWTPINHGLTTGFVYALAITPNGTAGANVFAGTKGGGIFLSSDDGANWTAMNSGLSNLYIPTLVADGPNLFAGALNGDVFRTTDSGAQWTKCGISGLLSGIVVDSILLVGTTSGVFRSTDHGSSWTAVNSGISDTTSVYAMATIGTSLFAATDQNIVCIRPLSQITGVSDVSLNLRPKEFALAQNYPNPFNPSTTIRYSLTSRSTVRLQVFNVLGQVVAELTNGEQSAGEQSISWTANVASGVYLYRIEATSMGNPAVHFVQTRKLVLLK
jgi:hypothetical protein